MVHVSRLAEEIVLWMSQNFGFIDLADRYCTGSSIMPQKRNPDVAELARGKSGRVVGHLMGLLTLMKGQPLDLQQGQPGRQGAAVRHRRHAARHAAHHGRDGRRHRRQARGDGARRAEGLRHRDRPRRLPGEEGPAVPRRARGGGACGEARRSQRGVDLAELPLDELQALHPAIGADVRDVLTLRGSLQSRAVRGGTAPVACASRSRGTASAWADRRPGA